MLRPLPALLLAAFAVSTASSCSRDLQLPPLPPPGSLTGHVTYAQPGSSEKRAAVGAAVGVMGSGLQTQTNPSGVFTLAWGDATDGLLMVRFDADGDGVIDRQRVVQLSEYNVGPNKHVDLGELLLGENASMRGRVLRGDVATHAGHSGSTIFVPEGPFSATTGDDGSFFLNDLPAGPVSLVAFRPGYEAHALGTVELRSGEQFTLGDVVLQPAPSQPPGGLSGKLVFVPSAADVGDTAVSLEAPSQAPRPGTLDGTFTFHFDAVPPGLYALRATRSGYTPLVVPNVLVAAGGAADLGTVEVTDAPVPDAGQPLAHDGGSGGSDGGGPPCTAGSCTACSVNAQCPLTEYCDFGHCASECASANDCSLGRSCDPLTHTCALACSGGFCPGGQGCEVYDGGPGLCRSTCDGTFPCGPGFLCDVHGLCVPQCRVAAECPAGLPVCHAGQCEPAGGCADDRQCTVDQVCFQGGCVQRPTARVNGGAYACTGPCDCRLGEWCHGAQCEVEAVPTAFFAVGATGDGRSMASPSGDLAGYLRDAGPGERLALKAQDTFSSLDPFRIRPGQDGLALRGGYTVCNASRWVRSDGTRSALTTDAGIALEVGDLSLVSRLTGAEISNLALTQGALWPFQTCVAPVRVVNVDGPTVARLEVSYDDSQCVESLALGSVQVESSTAASVSDVHLAVAKNGMVGPTVVSLTNSFGQVLTVSVTPPPQPMAGITLVSVTNATGPTAVSDCVLPSVTAAGNVFGVTAAGCAVGSALLLERNFVAWPTSSAGQNIGSVRFLGLAVSSCGDVTVRDNTIDGTAVMGNVPAGVTPASTGVYLSGVAGVVQHNVVRLPSPANAAQLSGISSEASSGPLTVTANEVTGGVTAAPLTGLSFTPVLNATAAAGPIVVEKNLLDVGAGVPASALWVSGVPPAAGLQVRDNLLRATGTLSCATRQLSYGVSSSASSGLYERNRIYASGGTTTRAFELVAGLTPGTLELYANHLWSGPAVCAGGSSIALDASALPATQLALMENTLDAEGDAVTESTIGLACDNTPILSWGNLIGGGRGLAHAALGASSVTGQPAPGCFDPASYQKNLLWLPPDGGALAANDWALVVASDGGSNALTVGLSPYDSAQPTLSDGGAFPPSRLAAGSVAIDNGVWPLRLDGSPVLLDLNSRPRDGGLGPDIGCCER